MHHLDDFRMLEIIGMLETVVEKSVKIFISKEQGGGGFVSQKTLRIAENRIRNILRHFEILPNNNEAVSKTNFMKTPEKGGYLMSYIEVCMSHWLHWENKFTKTSL